MSSDAGSTLAQVIPSQANAEWPAAVIGGAFQTGVLAVRGLKRRGVQAFCFDSNNKNLGFYSTYGPARLCPDSDTHPDSRLSFMQELAQEFDQRPVLIPSSEQYVFATAKHEEALREHYVLSGGI